MRRPTSLADLLPGDTVRWWAGGFRHGHFMRLNRKGNVVVRDPDGRRRQVPPDSLYAVHDIRMRLLLKERSATTTDHEGGEKA